MSKSLALVMFYRTSPKDMPAYVYSLRGEMYIDELFPYAGDCIRHIKATQENVTIVFASYTHYTDTIERGCDQDVFDTFLNTRNRQARLAKETYMNSKQLSQFIGLAKRAATKTNHLAVEIAETVEVEYNTMMAILQGNDEIDYEHPDYEEHNKTVWNTLLEQMKI